MAYLVRECNGLSSVFRTCFLQSDLEYLSRCQIHYYCRQEIVHETYLREFKKETHASQLLKSKAYHSSWREIQQMSHWQHKLEFIDKNLSCCTYSATDTRQSVSRCKLESFQKTWSDSQSFEKTSSDFLQTHNTASIMVPNGVTDFTTKNQSKLFANTPHDRWLRMHDDDHDLLYSDSRQIRLQRSYLPAVPEDMIRMQIILSDRDKSDFLLSGDTQYTRLSRNWQVQSRLQNRQHAHLNNLLFTHDSHTYTVTSNQITLRIA